MKNNFNILHFCIFLILCKIDYSIDKVLRSKRIENTNLHSNKTYLHFFNDEFLGINILNAGITLAAIIFFLLWGMYIFFIKLFFNIGNPFFFFPIIILLLFISYLLYYFWVLKNKKYLVFFSEYKKWKKFQKIKYITRSILFIFFTVCFFLLSLFL